MNDLSREFGSALGIAILGSILNAGYRSGLTPALTHLPVALADHARASIAFIRVGAGCLATLGAPGRHLIAAAKTSYVDATRTALLAAAILLLLAAVVVIVVAPRDGAEQASATIQEGSLDTKALRPERA